MNFCRVYFSLKKYLLHGSKSEGIDFATEQFVKWNIFAFPQSNLSNWIEKDSQKRIKKWFDKDWF